MAYSTIDKSTSFQNNVLYTGNGTAIGSGGQAITGVGFSADFTWLKERSSTSGHHWFDTPRGATEKISSDSTAAESANAETLASWQSDGFTVGSAGGANQSGQTYVAWNWKAGTTSGLSGGTITPSAYSINTTTKFGVYKYTGNGTSGATIAHGLGVAPKFLLTKKISATGDWHVAHQYNSAYPWNSYLYLNSNDGTQEENSATWFLNDTAPDATNITLGNGAGINGSGVDYVIYAWAPVTGYSSFGQYKGTGNADGTFVYTGFKPSFVLIKRYAGGTGNWWLWDNKREGYNEVNDNLYPDLTNAEDTSGRAINILSSGFKCINTDTGVNGDGSYYIYMAFGQPIVGSNGVVGTAR